MAEAKPKGEPVFLKIPATGETITLPGVTSLSGQDEVKTAANNWLAKNYKGLPVAEPIITRSPITGETQGVTIALSVAPVDTVSLIPTTPPGQVVPATAGAPQLTEEDRAAQSEMQGVYNAGITAGKTPDQILTEIAFVGQRYNRQIDPSYLDLVRKSADERIPFQFIATPSGETGAVEGLIGEVLKTEPGQMAAGYFGGATNALTAGFALDPATKEYLRETAPVSSFAGELTGGVLASIPAIRGAQIGLAGTRLAGAAPLIGETAYGALYGAGEAGPDNRLLGATYGGLTGLVGGALINRFMPGGPGTFTGAPKTALSPDMAAVAAPVAPAPVVPSKRPKAQAVELPEAPVAAAVIPEAVIPEAAVAPTPELAPAITPERLAEMRTSAEDVIKGMADGTPEAPAPERIGTLKATNFQTPDETKRFLSDVAKANKDFPEARRGTMTIGQINELSKDVNLKDILGRKISMPLNAEQIQAAKSVVYQNTEDAVAKAKTWVASGGQDPVAFQEAVDSLVSNTAFLETLQGASSELGRAMRVLRERPSVDLSIAMKQLLEQRAKGVSTEELIQSLATFDDPASAAKFVGKIATPTWKDKFKEYYINFWLSGIKTQTINLASNVLTAVSPLIEKPLEAGIGALRRTPDRVTFREVGARVAGMRQGTREGLKLAAQAFKTGESQSRVTRLDVQRNAIGGPVGEVVRIPTRLLLTQDEFFKSIARRGELNAQAFKKAFDESGGNRKKLDELFTKYKEEPTEAMQKAAEREAEYRTFQSELGRTGKNFQRFLAQSPTASFFIPFFKSPANLLKYAAERSPFAPLSDRWMTEIKAGGRQRDEALAKLSLGIGATGALVSYALEGKITGSGPTDPKERAALLATGWQPYSIKVGDTYYSIGKLDPYATLFGVVADAVTAKDYMTQEEYEKALAFIPFSIASNIAQKTYLQGFTNLYESLAGDYADITTVEKFIRDTAAGLAVPNLFRQAGAAIDPQVREANSIIKEVQNRIPVVRGNTFTIAGTDYDINRVPNKLNVWGDPITRTGALPVAGRPTIDQVGAISFNLLSPVGMSTTTKDPFLKEIGRLQLGVAPPKKEMSLSVSTGQEKPVKFKLELTDQERRQFTFVSGKLGKALIQADMATPEWKNLDDDERRAQIRKRMEFSRSVFAKTFKTRALNRYVEENQKLPPVQP